MHPPPYLLCARSQCVGAQIPWRLIGLLQQTRTMAAVCILGAPIQARPTIYPRRISTTAHVWHGVEDVRTPPRPTFIHPMKSMMVHAQYLDAWTQQPRGTMLPQPLNSLQRYVGTFFALLRQQNKQIKQCVDSDSNSIYRNPGKHYQQKKSSHCQLDLNCKRTS